jgi:hypothetical protein
MTYQENVYYLKSGLQNFVYPLRFQRSLLLLNDSHRFLCWEEILEEFLHFTIHIDSVCYE